MIRFRLAELMADKSFRTGTRVELQDIASATGIHRSTLSKMLHTRGYSATTGNIDLLCRYFGCKTGDVIEYVSDDEVAIAPAATD
jgi:putative transcriptional regulator